MCFWTSWDAWQRVRLNSSLQRKKTAGPVVENSATGGLD